jgi:hypothetical protein
MKTSPLFLKSVICRFIAVGLVFFLSSLPAQAQGPEGNSFGFGLILGDPLGLTVKLWTSTENAFVGDIGGSDFGPLRIQGDYLWHFNAFHSSVVKMYAGPGLALAFGGGEDVFTDHRFGLADNGVGIGARVMFGLNIIPRQTPIEMFFELGPVIAFVPGIGAGFDYGVGIRFYP